MKQLTTIDRPNDRDLGSQLTAQYERATGGMRDVLIFGAMMMRLRVILDTDADGSIRTGGAGAKDSGVKAWLDEHAPNVNRSTAYRFEDVAKAVAAQYALPARVTKALPFEQLVAADPKKLTPQMRKVQAGVFDFVAGKSQKSFLDQFREMKSRGGSRAAAKKQTPEQLHREFLEACKNDFGTAVMSLDALHENQSWKMPSIDDKQLAAACDLFAEMGKQMRAWLKVPKRDRTSLQASIEKELTE